MKKLFLLALTAMVATTAFAANYITVTVPTTNTRSDPKLWTTLPAYVATDDLLWKGNGTTAPSDTALKDFYFRIDTNAAPVIRFLVSWDKGWHSNVNFLFNSKTDGTDSQLTFSGDTPLNFNSNDYAGIFNLASETAGDKGIVNLTNAAVTFDMYCTDKQGGNATLLDNFGRKIYVGENITVKASGSVNINKFTTATEAKPDRGSLFSIAGTFEALTAGSTFRVGDSNVVVESTGIIDVDRFELVNTANTHFTLKGALYGTQVVRITSGTMDVEDGATINTPKLALKTGLNVKGDLLITNLTAEAAGATVAVAEGKTLTAASVVLDNDSSLTLTSGNITATKMTLEATSTSLSVAQGASLTVGDNTVANNVIWRGTSTIKGNLTIKSKAASGYSASIYLGNMTIDGGTVTENVGTDLSFALGTSLGRTLTVKSNGTLAVTGATASRAYLHIAGGTVKIDGTSHVTGTRNVVFSANSNSSLELGSTSVFASGIGDLFIRSDADNPMTGNRLIFTADAGKVYKVDTYTITRHGDLTFDLNGAKLEIGAVNPGSSTLAYTSVNNMIFEDFALGSVKVGGWDTDKISTGSFILLANSGKTQTVVLTAYDSNGTLIGGTWYVDANGYLGITGLIPEPAEWAAIFGVLAIAFAVMRRRKK